jgi:hypothetical protein
MKYIYRICIFALLFSPLLTFGAMDNPFIVCDPQPQGLIAGAPQGSNDCDFSKLILLINNVIQYLIFLATSIFSIVFMYAGYLYLTAMGDMGKVSKAHKLFWSAIIGFVIMLCAWLLVDFILTALVTNNPEKYRILSK